MFIPTFGVTLPAVVPVQMDEAAIWLELIDLALSRARISQKRAALDQGISLEQWYQQRQGRPGSHISLLRMFRLPSGFWREFVPLLAEQFGISLPTPALVRRLQQLVSRVPRPRRQPAPIPAWRQGRLF